VRREGSMRRTSTGSFKYDMKRAPMTEWMTMAKMELTSYHIVDRKPGKRPRAMGTPVPKVLRP
jgi:hypothetical protein